MSDKREMGRIDCPHCGYKNGMKIIADRKGKPFGHCDANCDGQLRVGGKEHRVNQFYAKYPHIKAAFEPEKEVLQVEKKEPVKVIDSYEQMMMGQK
jgi:hypothetical protein